MKKFYLILILFAVICFALIGLLLLNKDSNKNATAQTTQNNTESLPQSTQKNKTFSAEEVAIHNKSNDCWTIIENKVYDITPEIEQHPGGNEILRACGIDSTTLFKQRTTGEGQKVGTGTPHSNNAESQLEAFYIGNLQ